MSDREGYDEVETVLEEDLTSATPGAAVRATAQVGGFGGKQRSLTGDAWRELRTSPMFIFSGAIIVLMLTIALFPSLFTSIDPHDKQTNPCLLENSVQPPSAEHWFGFDLQGCDYYSRVIYGARPSIAIGILVVLFSVLIALLVGTVSGYYGGFTDTFFSRLTDIFFGIPFILGAIVFLSAIQSVTILGIQFTGGVSTVVVALTVFGWTTLTRLMRSSVLSARDMDYVQAARALGASNRRIMVRHILPNAVTPVVVYGTVSVGLIIAAEASLSFLGVGLRPPAISWGLMISESQRRITTSPHLLLFPGLFLSATVLAFLMLGDAVRDAFDPKLR